MVFDPFEPDGGRVGFLEHKTHFGDGREAARGGSDGAVFCGGRRDAANKLSGDHPGSKFRNKIIDPIEQNAQEPCGGINIHITGEDNVLFSAIVKVENRLRSVRFSGENPPSALRSKAGTLRVLHPSLAGN
jgi:hypothetical protein